MSNFKGYSVKTPHLRIVFLLIFCLTIAELSSVFAQPMLSKKDKVLLSATLKVQEYAEHDNVLDNMYTLFSAKKSISRETWELKAKAFLQSVKERGISDLQVEVRKSKDINNVWGAFAGGEKPVIYINENVLAYSTEEEIERIVLEEIGHWIDHEINGEIDSEGDEGELFVRQLLGSSLSETDAKRLLSENDHLRIEIDGVDTEVELASLMFAGQSYFAGIAPLSQGASATGSAGQTASLESNVLYIGNPLPGSRALFVSDPPEAPVYSGNNVRGTLYAVNANNEIVGIYYGEISRLIKEGSAPVAAQMYLYPSGTTTNVQATTIIVDFYQNRYPTLQRGDVVKTSSDPVASALNSLLPVNTPPTAVVDTDVAELANCNPVRNTPVDAVGNVISGVGTDNNAAGQDLDTDIQYIVNLLNPLPATPIFGYVVEEKDPLYISSISNSNTGGGVTVLAGSTSTLNFASVIGRYGTIKIGADGSYIYSVNGSSPAVLALEKGQTLTDVFTYSVTDRKGGISNITLTITINGGNEAPKAVNEFKYAEEGNSVPGQTILTVAVSGGLLINDTDPDAGNTLKITQAEKATSITDETFSSPVAVTATGATTVSRAIGYTFNRVGQGSSWNGNTGEAVFISRNAGTSWTNTGLFVNTVTSGGTKYMTFKTVSGNTTTSNPLELGYLDFKAGDRLSFATAGSGTGTIESADTESSTKFVLANTGTAPNVNDAVAGDGIQTNTKVNGVSTLSINATTVTYITLDKTVTIGTTNNSSTLNTGESLTFTQGQVIQGTYGYLNLKSDGSYTYVLTSDITNNTIVNEYFKYQISDESTLNNPGCTDAAVLHIQIQGKQTAPPTAGADAVDVIETGVVAGTSPLAIAATGVLSNDAIGSGGTQPIKVAKIWTTATAASPSSVNTSATIAGVYGSLVINADGSYTYTLNNANTTVDALLNATKTLTELFYYQILDSQNPAAGNVSTLTITIKGANDAPVAVDDASIAIEAGGFANAGGVNPTGNVLLNDTDVDTDDTKTVSKIISGAFAPTTTVSGATTIAGNYGSLTINPNGNFSYAVNNTNPAVDALKAGETLTETFTYELKDAGGATSTAKLVITIQGADDYVKVNNVSVNEGSPYIVFTVTGAAGQKVSLDLGVTGTSTGDATGSGTDFGSATGSGLEYFDGSNWVTYTSSSLVPLDANGKLLVRTAVKQDVTYEQQESFVLNATTGDGFTATGAGVIYDDGTGDYFAATNTTGVSSLPANTILDDDRALTVTDVTVNEASPFAVFTVTGAAGQQVTLSLSNTNQTAETADYGSGTGALQYFNTSTNQWVNYTPASLVTLGANGTLLVRTAITQDTENEGAETFKLIATNTGGEVSSGGTGTIKDDGTGDYFAPTNNTATPALPNNTTLDDDRPLTINNITVNEGSQYAVFEVSGVAGQLTSLSLANGTSTNISGLMYSTDNGATWTSYTSGTVALNSSGKILVRTVLSPEQESTVDNGETFTLTATNTGGTSATGTATIKDDGTGDIFNANGTLDTTTAKDDDRPLTVNNISVNEGSPYAVFTVTGATGQLVNLAITNASGAASGEANLGTTPALQYFNGTSWQTYDPANPPAIPAGTNSILVRVAISAEEEQALDGPETFKLVATNTGGVSATGTATIKDDGSGAYWIANATTPATTAELNAASLTLDDDRSLKVNSVTVNEKSPYAVFTVGALANQQIQLSLAQGSATSAIDFTNSLEYFDGTLWQPYTPGNLVNVDGSGKIYVRTPILQDDNYEISETFTLTVSNSSNTVSSSGTGAIVDDGTGDYWIGNATLPATTTQLTAANIVLDDDRPLTVNDISVNEGSPYAVFEVSGVAGQLTSLTLTNVTTAGLNGLEYSTDGGLTWTTYNSGKVALNGFGKLLVRTSLIPEQETTSDNGETFTLKASNLSNISATGTATISDDGTGDIFNANGTLNTTTTKDDDRALTVTDVIVNEGSPYAVFTVSGAPNQQVKLSLADGGATSADYGSGLEYFDGTSWVAYTPNSYVTLDANGKLLVRTPIKQDTNYEGSETFKLIATNTGGSAAEGTGTIKDDGTGNYYAADNNTGVSAVPTGVVLDDDRPLSVNSVTVNEGSPYAVFTITGVAGKPLSLSLSGLTSGTTDPAEGTAALGTSPALEYFNGTNWVAYDAANPPSIANGSTTMLVRVAISAEQETALDGPETFSLVAAYAEGKSATGTATIKDDGTGNYYAANNNTGTSAVPTGVVLDDDRPLSVNSVTVNEESPYAVFTVTALEGKPLSLSLNGLTTGITDPAEGTAALGTSPALEYFNGTSWVAYDAANPPSIANGSTTMLVRVAISAEQEAALDGPETFSLVAAYAEGKSATGTATIKDDGTGNYYAANNNTGTSAVPTGVVLDDDRALAVTSVIVNEGSPYAVFTVSGAANQQVKLSLADGNATSADYGSGLEYFNGTSWVAYTPDSYVTLDANGKLLVRTPIKQDANYEGSETFKLIATNTGGSAAEGTGTIKDDGTGNYYAADNNTGVSAIPTGVVLDDDRPLSVNSVTVNEGSPYAVFTITGVAGKPLSLSLSGLTSGTTDPAEGTAALGTSPALEYFNGTNWVAYDAANPPSIANGSTTMLVRVAISAEQETALDGPETFSLVAAYAEGKSATGTATIKDDGTGDYYAANNNTGTSAVPTGVVLDDDRPLSVNSVTVNEGSPYAVFEVSGVAGQQVKLSLADETATASDYGAGLEYYNGSAWVAYTANSFVSLDANGKLLVRTPIKQDAIYEGSETFKLIATNSGGTPAEGIGTIKDDGTGSIWIGEATTPATLPELFTAGIKLDDDRPKLVADKNATAIGVPVDGSVATNDVVASGSTYGTPVADANNPAGAVIIMNPDGTYTFTATTPGEYIYEVPVCAPGQTTNCPTAKLSITVIDPSSDKNIPVVNPDQGITEAGTPVKINVLANDKSGNDAKTLDPASVAIATQPANGTVLVNADGTITYTPNVNYVGTDVFTYTVCETGSTTNCQTTEVYVEVRPTGVKHQVMAADDYASMPADPDGKASVSGNVLSNDGSTQANPTLTASLVSGPTATEGTLVFNPDGTYTFTPAAGFIGTVDVVYTVCDNNTPASCATATLHILVVSGDSDGDGVSDAQEIKDGTDPKDPCSYKEASQKLTATSAKWKTLDCDGDGVLNGTDPKPLDPCVWGTGNPTPDINNTVWQNGDCDSDGIPNKVEGIADQDGDGIPNYRDTDSDGDGLSDKDEAGADPTKPRDTDGDGLPDYLDLDSDNDGITDAKESGGNVKLDTDKDGIPDHLDLDADGDGITDVIEADGTDADQDGRADGASDAKGIPVSAKGGLNPPDTDKDGKPDFQDVDTDGDGIPDNREGQGTYIAPKGKDTDGDGLDDAYDKSNGGTYIVPVDTDKDGKPDWRDLDSDNDGIPDADERGPDGNNPLDTDKDGIPDYREIDSDNNGIPDNETLLIWKTATKPVMATDGTYTMNYTITLRNERPEPITNVQIAEDFTKTFPNPMSFQVMDVRSAGVLTKSASFDGRANVNLLAAGVTLNGKQQDSIIITVKIYPNGYNGDVNNIADGSATTKWGPVNRSSIDITRSGGRLHGAALPTVSNLPLVNIFIADVLTPNNDGKNDSWIILRPSNIKVGVTIFNRWGQAIYKSADYRNDWKGTSTNGFGGNMLPGGTYYYLVELSGGTIVGKDIRKGYMTLIRD